LAAARVITARNPVHAVLFLVLAFFSAACLWILLAAEFLAIVLVLVYVGAVMVLFLFVVMMLDIKLEPLREGFIRYLPVGVVVAAVMLVEMLALIGVRAMAQAQAPANPAGDSNIAWLGEALFTRFLLPFEIAALILTVGIVAAVALTLRRRTGVRHQDPARQVAVDPRTRVRLVKMAAERGQEQAP
ncbi:MAG: NADH-quinone oxidoreductase subunit J, partial [Xanthomonadaceae bacterium]|nr:NADH-quinone oxidoreductase subunit J [Xanthomonadaceae bacterium]